MSQAIDPVINEPNRYVGYLNDVDLFIEAMYDEKRNPNGIGKIKLCVNSSVNFTDTNNGMGYFYREIFGLNNSYISSSYLSSSENSELVNKFKGGNDISKTIKFIINDNFSLNGGNDWESSIDKAISSVEGRGIANKLLRKTGAKSPSAILSAIKATSGITGTQIKTLMQTVKFWNGSKDPGPFVLKFNLLATNPDMDIRRDLLALYASVFPISMADAYGNALRATGKSWDTMVNGFGNLLNGNFSSGFSGLWEGLKGVLNNGSDSLTSGFMSAPLGYNPVNGYISSLNPTTDEGSGLVDLRIGKWLHIPNLLVSSFSANISKVTTRYGYPLYASCVIGLKPVRMWTISDVYDSFYSTVTSNEYVYRSRNTGIQDDGTKARNMGRLDDGKITKVKIGDMP